MSTFDGFVKEFPEIRSCYSLLAQWCLLPLPKSIADPTTVDHFRPLAGRAPPVACFLSHVHSDHLQGLEGFRSPFIYCSPATRELLLRLEKRPARLNFASGLVETRVVQYKHLRKLLRPVPLNTPTLIELSPGREIRVSLLDANHCPGSVMFLIESGGSAVLYTGDVRAEAWWVESLARSPCAIPYTTGLRRLDNVYLDTTFATKSKPYRNFPSKREGIAELLRQVARYPCDAVFHLHSWTFGYEQVWTALSAALRSQVHVDEYKMRLFASLVSPRTNGLAFDDAAALCGFKLGNKVHPGCLTDREDVRLHSCERGHGYRVHDSESDVIHIIPIVSRLRDGGELGEAGAGGGYRDLIQDAEIDVSDALAVDKMIALCNDSIPDSEQRARVVDLIKASIRDGGTRLALDADALEALEDDTIALGQLPALILRASSHSMTQISSAKGLDAAGPSRDHTSDQLPTVIRFPYSRHSSYRELCGLIGLLRPRDIHPCTVDETAWHPGRSMRSLFGHLCPEAAFSHDDEMLRRYGDVDDNQQDCHGNAASFSGQTQSPQSQEEPTAVEEDLSRPGAQILPGPSSKVRAHASSQETAAEHGQDSRPPKKAKINRSADLRQEEAVPKLIQDSADSDGVPRMPSIPPQSYHTPPRHEAEDQAREADQNMAAEGDSQVSMPDSAFDSQGSFSGVSRDAGKIARRREAYKAAKGRKGMDWASYSTLRALGRRDEADLD